MPEAFFVSSNRPRAVTSVLRSRFRQVSSGFHIAPASSRENEVICSSTFEVSWTGLTHSGPMFDQSEFDSKRDELIATCDDSAELLADYGRIRRSLYVTAV